LLLAAASPPTTPKALVIPRRLISDNADYPIVADNQRGKRIIMYDSGEGSHPRKNEFESKERENVTSVTFEALKCGPLTILTLPSGKIISAVVRNQIYFLRYE
jgi:hypothetical protein